MHEEIEQGMKKSIWPTGIKQKPTKTYITPKMYD